MNDKISLENRIVAVNTTIECQVEDEVNVVTKRKKEIERERKKERESRGLELHGGWGGRSSAP